jgi:raffinose/stachyose/melibiose transport system permease protein
MKRKLFRREFTDGKVGPVGRGVAYLVMLSFTALTLLPLLWLLYSSFKSNVEIMRSPLAWPQRWTTANYAKAWTVGHLGTYMLNTVLYTGVATAVTVLLGLSTGFAFAKLRYRITGWLSWFLMAGLLISVQAVLVPLYLTWTRVGLYDTRPGVILPYIAFGLPMAVYLCTEFVRGIPDALVEAAILDGASYFMVFLHVVLPLARPVVTTVAILTFLGNWNEFVFAFMLVKSERLRSLSVGINSFAGSLNFNYGLQFASLVIGILPVILFYVLFHKQLIAGFAEGALKD